MGTAKRERQKANRQLRYEALAKQHQSRKRRRRGLQFGIIIPVVVAAVSVILFLVTRGDDSTSSDTTPDTVDTSVDVTDDTAPVTDEATTTTIAPTPCPKEDGSSPKTTEFPRPMGETCIDATKVYVATVWTNKGSFNIELDPGIAPITVNNFVALARYHFFDGTVCTYIKPDFIVQCGSPDGSAGGGPGYTLRDELPTGTYALGAVAMARTAATSGSQFFIVAGDEGTKLTPNYSLFGKVTEGLDTTVKSMAAAGTETGTPSEPIKITKVTISVKEGATASTTTTSAVPTTAAAETSSSGG